MRHALALVACLVACGPAPPAAPQVFPGAYTALSQTGWDEGSRGPRSSGGESCEVISFGPRFPLWTDGLVKRRWLVLPPGGKIDTSDPDHWSFPVGTRFFKEFATPSGQVLEVRLIERIAERGDPATDYWMGAFVPAPGGDATVAGDGAVDVLGTTHDVPTPDQCRTCHNGEPGRILGFSLVQLSGPSPDLPVEELAAQGRLSHPLAAWRDPDGPAEALEAIGTLHGNCGHCHNPRGAARPDTDLDLRIRAVDHTLADTGVYRTAVGKPNFRFAAEGVGGRIVPGDPAASAVLYRMSRRGPRIGMPPLGSEVPDEAAVARVAAWIDSL